MINLNGHEWMQLQTALIQYDSIFMQELKKITSRLQAETGSQDVPDMWKC